ncbi:MAG: DNA polymerase I [Patescibacteria group bacterium]|nr:DNA polymerase I [Patescibacteria group bacterium]MDD5490947.1 DNA polymerase I [Patescibacteria group bacterium]
MAKKKQFIIIDGYALLHRAWHAIPPLTTKSGELVNAVYGFTSILLTVLKEFKPEYVAVALDRKEPTFRHQEYKEYKATREKQPEELYVQLNRVREIVGAFGIPIYEKSGFEADDVIGTICAKKSVDTKEIESVIVTGDMDTLQLVDDNTVVYTLRKGIKDTVLYDERGVRERFDGLNPDQLIDYKALRGDASDNISGVPGIGEKTALNLVKEFGNLENLYKNLDSEKISDKVRGLLKENKDKAFLSKHLVTIVRDVPLELNLDATKFGEFDREKISKIFQELQFSSLLKRIPGLGADESVAASKKKLQTRASWDYSLINDSKSFKKFLAELKKQKIFCVDTETTSLDFLQARLLGISFCWKASQAFYVVTKPEFIKELKPLLEDEKVKKVGHHLKYDLEILKEAGINLRGMGFDTMLASYLLNPGSRAHKLDTIVFNELGHRMISFEDLVGTGKNKVMITDVPVEKLAEYSCEDADYTWQLKKNLEAGLVKEKLAELLEKLEMPLIEVLATMEKSGVKIDSQFLKKMSKKMSARLEDLAKEIYKIAGVAFNINSPLQLKEILFDKLKISTQGLKKIKTGISTAAPELEKMRGRHKIIDLISEHRELAKLKSTYLDALPKLVSEVDGRVHTSFNQTITATGRLSSSDPNLQNIPIRTELGREIRKAFIAEKGFKILSADYSQIELRVLAHIADDKNMIKAFREGQDIHTTTAAKINNVAPSEVTGEQRRAAKAVNFGIAYGMGANRLAQSTGMSREEAQEFIGRYFGLYPNIKKYIEGTKNFALRHGYVQTLFGRKRYLPDITSGLPQLRSAAERMAINMPIQGTAADLIKMAMIVIYKELPAISKTARMLLQVHDELVFEVPEQEAKKVGEFIKEKMENIFKLKVPLIVDVTLGDNWGAKG